MDILLIGLIGLLAGGVVNTLADSLSDDRALFPPVYPDGSQRPLSAWLGVTAFALGQRAHDSRSKSGRRLSIRYPLTEAIVAGALMLAEWKLGWQPPAQLLIWQVEIALLVLIAVVDIEGQRIELIPLIGLGALAFGDALLLPGSPPSLASAMAGGAFGGAVFGLVYLGGRVFARVFVRARDSERSVSAFGIGDVYLMAVGGLMIGFPNALAALLLAIVLGGAGALLWLAGLRLRGRSYQRFMSLPYAPYIAAGIALCLVFQAETYEFLTSFIS